MRYIVEDVARALGRDIPIDIISGTSAGSINAGMLAAYADRPGERGELAGARNGRTSSSRTIVRLVRRARSSTWRRACSGAGSRRAERRRGGVLDPSGIERIVRDSIPFDAIDEPHSRWPAHGALDLDDARGQRAHRDLRSAAASRASRAGGATRRWSRARCRIRADHVLASAAVPLLFPAVEIDGQFYCDGGLRQNVPLSPARRLGADGLIVINPRYIREDSAAARAGRRARARVPRPALRLRQGDERAPPRSDRERHPPPREAQRGARRGRARASVPTSGPRSTRSSAAAARARSARSMSSTSARREDIGVLAAEYVRSPEFAKRVPGLIGRGLRRIGEGESEADLLSYVLFDGAVRRPPHRDRAGATRARATTSSRAFFAKRLHGVVGPCRSCSASTRRRSRRRSSCGTPTTGGSSPRVARPTRPRCRRAASRTRRSGGPRLRAAVASLPSVEIAAIGDRRAADGARHARRGRDTWCGRRSSGTTPSPRSSPAGSSRRWARRRGRAPAAASPSRRSRSPSSRGSRSASPRRGRASRGCSVPHDWLTWRLTGRFVTDRGDASGTGWWSPAENRYREDLLAARRRRARLARALPEVLGPLEVAGQRHARGRSGELAPGARRRARRARNGRQHGGRARRGPSRRAKSSFRSAPRARSTRCPSDPVADATGNVGSFADATGTLPSARVHAQRDEGDRHVRARAVSRAGRVRGGGAPRDAGGRQRRRARAVPRRRADPEPARRDRDAGGPAVRRAQPAHIARAAFEGVVCGLLEALDALGAAGVDATGQLLLVGGGARSLAYRRIVADLARRRATVPRGDELVATGACVQAAAVLARAAAR